MAVLIWITRATGLVPGWCWAIVVAVLAALVLRLDAGMAHARADAGVARAELLQVQLASRDAITSEISKARAKEAPLIDKVMEANNAVTQARLDMGAAAAAAAERLRQLARPVRLCRADPGAGATSATGPGGGEPVPAGLREVDGRDLLVVDAQGRVELGRFSASANLARQALSECLSGWQAAHAATN